jgi:hypothetical protein
VGKPEGKNPLVSLRCRWKDNIKIVLQKSWWKALSGLVWLRAGRGGEFL